VPSKKHASKALNHEPTGRSRAWGYFDGANQGDPPICMARGTLFISNTRFFRYKASLREGSINYVELLALKLLDSKKGGSQVANL
jgi:hypothetical protein